MLGLSGDPKLLFDLTPSEHTMGRFSTRVRGKKTFPVRAGPAHAKEAAPARHRVAAQSRPRWPFERPLAQRVPAGGRTQIFRLDEGKKAFSAHVSGPNCFGNLLSHPEEEKLTARSVLLCVVDFLWGHAHLQDVTSAHEGPKAVPRAAPSAFFKWKTAQAVVSNTSATHRSSLNAIVVGRVFFPSMHSRDVTCARLASATAPASRSSM